MSPDLETEGRRAGTALRAQFATIPVPPMRVVSGRRRRLVAAVAAVAVAAALVAALIIRWDTGSSVGPVAPSSMPGWERIQLAGAGFGRNRAINTATTWHGSFFTAGYVFTPDRTYSTPTTATIWSSPDGRHWTHAELPKASGYQAAVEALVATRRGLLAIGSISSDIGDRLAENVVWRSVDGRSWQTFARGSNLLGQGAGFVAGARSNGSGVVAWGSASRNHGPQEPAVWTSKDGARWTRVLVPSSPAIERGQVEYLTRTASGWFALGGLGDTARPVAWSAENLSGWTRLGDHLTITNISDPRGLDVGPVVAIDNTLLAAYRSSRGGTTTGLLRSDDGGMTWTPAPGPNGQVDALLEIGNRLVAAGYVAAAPSGQGPPEMWTSVDAQTWTPMPGLGAPPGGTLTIVAAEKSVLVAFGAAPELGDYYRWAIPGAS